MKIQKILNNNAATALNDRGQECVLVGKGIAFGKRVGDSIDDIHAVKIFKSAGQGLAEKLSSLVEGIPLEHVKVCNEIVADARDELGELNDKVFLTLIDHISFAIERHNKGILFADTLWEIQRQHPNEHRVGLRALDIIDKRLGVRLPDNEATFIAFHLVNANASSTDTARGALKLIDGILCIIRRHFSVGINEDTARFTRLMTHLRFFASRVVDSTAAELEPGKMNKLLVRLLSGMPAEKACVDEIAAYVKHETGRTVSPDEKSYLCIHIHSIVDGAGTENEIDLGL